MKFNVSGTFFYALSPFEQPQPIERFFFSQVILNFYTPPLYPNLVMSALTKNALEDHQPSAIEDSFARSRSHGKRCFWCS